MREWGWNGGRVRLDRTVTIGLNQDGLIELLGWMLIRIETIPGGYGFL